MSQTRARRLWWLAAGVVILALALYATAGIIGRSVLGWAAGKFSGTSIHIGGAHIGLTSAHLSNVVINSRSGEPIARIGRIDATYNLRDAISGKNRAYGLKTLEVIRPRVSIVRHPDGSYNFTLPKFAAKKKKAGAPLIVSGRIVDGSITALNQAWPAGTRPLRVDDMQMSFSWDSAARSRYAAHMLYHEDGRAYTIAGIADLNRAAGYELQHWHVPAMPIARIADFAVGSHNLHIESGRISGLDLRIFALPGPTGAMQATVAATTTVSGGVIASPALARPLRRVRGRLDLTSQGAIFDGLRGDLAGIPIAAVGGVYDLSHPTLRMALHARGDMAAVRSAVRQASRLPVSGALDLHALAFGTAKDPLVIGALRAPAIRYLRSPVRDVRALLAVTPNELDIINGTASYGGFNADAHGRVAFASGPRAIAVIAHVRAPADSVPYAADLVPGMSLGGTLAATASNPKSIDTHGVLFGSDSAQRLAAAFAVRSDGVGNVGPLLVTGDRGRLYAQASLDHPRGVNAAFVAAHHYRIAAVKTPPLPGFTLPAIPPLRGTLDATALGVLDRGRAAAMGSGRLALPLDVAGAIDPALHARGALDAPFALLAYGNRALVQIDRTRFTGASIDGVPVRDAAATLALRPGSLEVLAAYAHVRGGNAFVSGTPGKSAGIAITASGVRALGGSISAGALVHGTLKAPAVLSTVVADRMTYRALPLTGLAALHYRSGSLTISNASFGLASGLVWVGGNVRGIAPGKPLRPAYDIEARARALEATNLIAMVQPARARTIAADLDADLRIRGAGTRARVRGTFDVPEGTVNGLSFTHLHGELAGSPQAIAMTGGGVNVGSTTLALRGSFAPRGPVEVAVSTPHADLSDFNDFFPKSDVLGGTGYLRVAFGYAPGAISSSGRVALTSVRYARLPIGRVNASWSTRGTAIALIADAGGPNGTLRANGSIDPASRALNASFALDRMNLKNWVPVMGISEPVEGYLDASGTASGRFPDVDSNVKVSVSGGRVGRITLQRAALAMHTTGGRGRIDSAVIAIPGASVTLAGGFGLHAGDALALTAHASAPDIGSVYTEMTGAHQNLAGALTASATLDGTRAQPRVTAQTTLRSLRFNRFSVPFATSQVEIDRRSVRVQRAQIDFARGRLTASAALPLSLKPLDVPRAAPFTASLSASDVELSNFAAMLPQGTSLAGRLDGTVNAKGSVGNPQFNGLLTLAQLSYAGPQLSTRVTGGAQLAFSGQRIALQNTLFYVGGGTVVATAAMNVPSVHDLAAVAVNARVIARNAAIDAPKYYKGRIDGSIAMTRVPGAPLTLSGTTTLSSARIPLTAFMGASSKKTSTPLPLDVAFNDFTIAAGNDVRVQSPNVDVGATGSLTLNGTLSQLAPSGSFLSTGGTLSFYRTFTVQRASVAFSPQSGIMPDINAVATTYIPDPSTEIRLHVTGPATDMNLALASQPGYDRSQILGLLVGAQQFGAVQGVASTGGGSFSATGAVTSMAEGQLNTLFARNLLEPLSSALASTFGFTNVQLTSNLAQGQYGASVVKAFGKNLHAIFAQTFGYPQRTSFALEARPNATTAIRADVYTQPDVSLFPLSRPPARLPTDQAGEAELLLLRPMSGTNGVDLNYVRRFW